MLNGEYGLLPNFSSSDDNFSFNVLVSKFLTDLTNSYIEYLIELCVIALPIITLVNVYMSINFAVSLTLSSIIAVSSIF
jgi:hypothetical protein